MNGILQTESYVLGGRIYPPSAILTKKEFKDPQRLETLEKNLRNKGNGVYFGRDFRRNLPDNNMRTITDLNLNHLVLSNDTEYSKQQRQYQIAMSDENGRLSYSTKLRNIDGSNLLQYSNGFVAYSPNPVAVQAHNNVNVGQINWTYNPLNNDSFSVNSSRYASSIHSSDAVDIDVDGDGVAETKDEPRYAGQEVAPSKWNGRASLEDMKYFLFHNCGLLLHEVNEIHSREQARTIHSMFQERQQRNNPNRGSRRQRERNGDLSEEHNMTAEI